MRERMEHSAIQDSGTKTLKNKNPIVRKLQRATFLLTMGNYIC